ncbi:unnamed protein product [Spirodela intermedia]|uniref:Uncharacterized protein n=1 Tax=Spirodela intermedia TaxID=51605 RepID=A0A7I8LKT5_SPIIN|nr:unnamed protein product [Spirodela intermedia]
MSLVRKKKQRARPMVCAPERATRSCKLRPLLANLVVRAERLNDGPGRLMLASFRLAVVASRRPRGTVHQGPPLCMEE